MAKTFTDYTLVDSLLVGTSMSYIKISEKVGLDPSTISIRAKKLRKDGVILRVRKRGRPAHIRVPLLKLNLVTKEEPPSQIEPSRRAILLEEALTLEYTPAQLAFRAGYCRRSISRILQQWGLSCADITHAVHQTQEEKKTLYQRLVDSLQQGYFDLLIEEKGLDYALAWRVKEYSSLATKYPLETLEKLICARRKGEGYYKSIKSSGIAQTTPEITRASPSIRRLLHAALYDVFVETPVRSFNKSQPPETLAIFARLWNEGRTYEEIYKEVGKISIDYFARKLHLPRRDRSSVDYQKLDSLLHEGVGNSSLVEAGFSPRTISRRKRYLALH